MLNGSDIFDRLAITVTTSVNVERLRKTMVKEIWPHS